MTDEIVFDNFIITDDRELHSSWLEQTFEKKSNAEYYSGGVSDILLFCFISHFYHKKNLKQKTEIIVVLNPFLDTYSF